MTLNELRDFIFENHYKRIGFVKEKSLYLMKRLNKIFVVPCNQINRKKTLILVMLKYSINHIEEIRTQNQ